MNYMIHYSLKPEKDGLFCEKTFGPVHSYKCSCGKKSVKGQKWCPECYVLFTTNQLRRYKLGYIQLFNPVLHIWYFKSRPDYLSILLNFTRKKSESIIYCSEILAINVFSNNLENLLERKEFLKVYYSKNRKIDKIKNFLFINSLTTSYDFLKTIQLKQFSWTKYLSKSFPMKIFLKIQYYRKYQKNFYKFKDFTINFSVKKIYSCRKFFYITTSKTKKIFKSNLSKQKKSTFDINFWEKIENFKLEIWEKSDWRFGQYCYSIPLLFGWINSFSYEYFMYYMAASIPQNDFIIFYYKFCVEKVLNFELNFNTGAPILQNLLQKLTSPLCWGTVCYLEMQIKAEIFEITNMFLNFDFSQKIKLLRRLKLIWCFRRLKNNPSWITILNLPVLPPALRPIIQLEEDEIAISDLNKLYQKILFRNRRIQKLRLGHYSNNSAEMQYTQRLLQESVDALIENGKNTTTNISSLEQEPLKSLSDILKGKEGRFRQNLLGKRVDYSGRSVIVVGPTLRLHECGIPKEMAIELFQPFLIRYLLFYKKAQTILGAKQLLQNLNFTILEILKKIMSNHPILLNRAPTLHRLNIQAFVPKLVEGRAILLHPLVCASFNADFDGDQMAVHLPLSFEARSEAWKLIWARNNLLSPATGLPMLMPTQDMIIGCYFLTVVDFKKFYFHCLNKYKSEFLWDDLLEYKKISHFIKFQVCKNFTQALQLLNDGKVDFQTPIWIYWKGFFENEIKIQKRIEIRISNSGNVNVLGLDFQFQYNFFGKKISQILRTAVGRVVFNQLF